MNRFISQKFRFYSFLCISLLLFVHGYNLRQTYLIPASLVDEPLTFTSFFEYFVSNGILRFRIPLLFMISGYIFALQDRNPYWQRIRKRFITLIIPFLIWSAIGIAITYLWQQGTMTALAVENAKVDQLGVNKPYAELGWLEVLRRWLLAPPSYQLWFIRNLFVYNLLYPFFRWVVKKYPLVWFTVMFILMLKIFEFYVIDGQGMFFFTLGIWVQKNNFPIDRRPAWFSEYLYWLIFVGLAFIRTFMAYEFETHTIITYWIMTFIYYCTVIAGIIAVWFSADPIVKWCMRKKWFTWAASFAFIIFGLHVPLLNYVINLSNLYFHNIPYYRILSYIVIPILVLLFCIGVGALLKWIFPRFYRVATGGRGI